MSSPPPNSRFRLVHLVIFLIFLALWTIALLIPYPQDEAEKTFGSKDRVFFFGKGLHISAYAFLTMLGGSRIWGWPKYLWILLGLPAHGAATEVLQGYTGRGPRVEDFLLDSCGVVVGTILLLVGAWIWSRVRKPVGGNHGEVR